MNVGERQRRLSAMVEQDPGIIFHDLYGHLWNRDWLRLAHDYVAQNAGSITAGCDGMTMKDFDRHLEVNLECLREDLKAGTFTGSVANFAQRARKGQLDLPVWGLSSQGVE